MSSKLVERIITMNLEKYYDSRKSKEEALEFILSGNIDVMCEELGGSVSVKSFDKAIKDILDYLEIVKGDWDEYNKTATR